MFAGLRRIRYFGVLAQELNFRRTATLLNITQPALSRAIAQLESDLGVKLLERDNRQVRLTVAGSAFASGSGHVLRDLDEVVEQTLKVAEGYAGYLNVGYTDTAIAGRLPDIVNTFTGIAPEIHIRLISAHTEKQFAMLDAGTLDIGFMTGPILHDRYRTLDVQADRLLAILPSDYPLARRDALSLSDLAEPAFILGHPDQWGVFNAHLFRQCERAGVRLNVVQTAPDSRAILGLVSCGLGVTILPDCLVRTNDERLAARPIADLASPMTTQAGWVSATPKGSLLRLIEHLEGYALPTG